MPHCVQELGHEEQWRAKLGGYRTTVERLVAELVRIGPAEARNAEEHTQLESVRDEIRTALKFWGSQGTPMPHVVRQLQEIVTYIDAFLNAAMPNGMTESINPKVHRLAVLSLSRYPR